MTTDPYEVIDLTLPSVGSQNAVHTPVNHCNLVSDDIIVIDESDSSFTQQHIIDLQQRRKSVSTRTELLKNKRFTVLETPEKKIGECPICCERLGKKPMSSTKCGHVFCLECINKSLKFKKQCPQCRQSLKGPSSVHPLYLQLK